VLHLEEKLTEDKEAKGQARRRPAAYDASVEEETRGGWSGLRVTRGEKEGRGARRRGRGGGVRQRRDSVESGWQSTIGEGTRWGGAWYRVLHVGHAWPATAGPSWDGPEEQ
jgi:hypothetical protein